MQLGSSSLRADRAARSIAVVAAAVLSVACTPDNEVPGARSTPSPTPGGTLEIGIVGEPATLDPYGAEASDLTYALVRPVFPMPFRSRPDGTFEPDLAESLEVTSRGARLTIAERIWSNGESITASDVVASIRRATPPSGFASIRSARVQGARTVVLQGASDGWEERLATAAYVLPRGRLIGGNVSGGPFRFSGYKRGRSLSYEANPDAPEPPLLDGLTVSFVQGTELLMRLLADGDLDVAALPSTVNLGERLDELGLEHASEIGAERVVMSFDPDRVTLRAARAVVAEVDKVNLVESFVRDEGRALGTRPPRDPDGLPPAVSVAAPEGDELLTLMQRAMQVDLRSALSSFEVITAPVSTLYGEWQNGGPADALLMRAVGEPPWRGVETDGGYVFPLASVATFMGWREEVHGIAVNPSPEGPLWNARDWWIEPSI
jgi:hypothetical protein